MADEFKVIKIERFDTKGIRHAYDDVGRQTFNNRVSFSTLLGWKLSGPET